MSLSDSTDNGGMRSSRQPGASATGVVETTKEQAGEAAGQAMHEVRDLAQEARSQVLAQATTERDKAVRSLSALAGELRSMADRSDQNGLGADLVRNAAQRVQSIGAFVGDREPGQLLDEVRSFARRKPGVFVLGALVAGAAVGRLTRGAVAASQESSHGSNGSMTQTRIGSMSQPQSGAAWTGSAMGTPQEREGLITTPPGYPTGETRLGGELP
jgi:hypothetical protein